MTFIVRGRMGQAGAEGSQGRFVVYGYINAAVAPTAAPTGGSFVQSTDVLTVPTGYTATPSTPVSGSETYQTEAVVNPETDADTVVLVWSIPAELPAYLAASLAETAADEAETASGLAQQYAGQAQDIPAGSPRGVLVATSPTLPTAATGSNSVIAFGAAELWTIDAGAPDGFAAGETATNERLYLPDIHPAGSNGIWIVIEVADVEIAEVFISQGGIQGATGADRRLVVPVSLTADALVRVGFWHRAGATAGYIQVTGNSDTLPADTVVKVYTAVVRGAGGTGPGGGLSAVSSDATLDGDGTTGDPLGVSNPFTAADEAKLDDLPADATAVTIAQVLAQIMAGAGVSIDRTTAGQITISADSSPAGHPSLRFGVSADDTPVGAELTIAGAMGMGLIPAYVGNMYLLIGRLSSEDDISSVLFSDDPTDTNQVGSFAKFGSTVDVGGDTYNVWVTNQAVDNAAGVTLTVG